MKKTISILITVLLLVTIFAGCNKSNLQNSGADFVEGEIIVDETDIVKEEETPKAYNLNDLDFKINGMSIDFLGLTVTEFCERTGYKATAVGDINNRDSNLDVEVTTFGCIIVEKADKTLYLDVRNYNDNPCPILDCKINGITDEYEGPLNYGDYHPVSGGLSVNGVEIGNAVTCEDIEKALNMKAFEKPDTENFGIATFTNFSESSYYNLSFTITDGKIDGIHLRYII
ncbi:MAG: hypothetical protein ACI37Z_03285 [Candidatus Gastranaerophilaceae bacterium]